MRPFQQPSDVNFTRSIPKVASYQGVAQSWQHGKEQIGIACFESGGWKTGLGNRVLKRRTFEFFTFKSIEQLLHQLTPEKVNEDRFWETTP
jgi:hypothetical protein